MENEGEPSTSHRMRPVEILTLGIAAVSLFAIALSLLGTGVAMAIESVLGIPHNTVLNSPFDALELSTTAVARGLSHLDFVFNRDIYIDTMLASLPIFGVLVVGCTLLAILYGFLYRRRFTRGKSDWLAKLLRKPNPTTDSIGLTLQRGALIGAFGVVLLQAGIFIVLILMIIAASILAVIPLVGFEAGRAYLYEYAISTEHCIPILDRPKRIARWKEDQEIRERGERRNSVPGATCVAIKRQGSETLYGRVALSTSAAIVLYDPVSGTASRVPITDAIIESVNALPSAPSTSKPTR